MSGIITGIIVVAVISGIAWFGISGTGGGTDGGGAGPGETAADRQQSAVEPGAHDRQPPAHHHASVNAGAQESGGPPVRMAVDRESAGDGAAAAAAAAAAGAAARQAAAMWNADNPGTVRLVGDVADGDVVIVLTDRIEGDTVGLYEHPSLPGRPATITVETGRPWCDGTFRPYSGEMMADTIAHELGHHLGLGHVTDESHLMYGTRDPPGVLPESFDDLGYDIPQAAEHLQFDAVTPILARMQASESQMAGLEEEMDGIVRSLDRMETEHGRLVERYEQLGGRYERLAAAATGAGDHGQAESLYVQLGDLLERIRGVEAQMEEAAAGHDRLGDSYNDAVDSYNAAAAEYNCSVDGHGP